MHTAGPVRAEVVAPGGRVVRDLGALPHPGGRVAARWNGRDAAGRVLPDGSYRLKVSLSGRHIELLNPLALDTSVGILGTNVSRRVISPDCDARGDRVIVVVRGREQLAGVRLEVRKGDELVRTVRVGRRARALAVSWPPYDGKRCTTAPDGRYRLRVIARDVPGNTRAVDLGAITARGVVLSPPGRRSSRVGACGSASRPMPAACGSSVRASAAARRRSSRAARAHRPPSRAFPPRCGAASTSSPTGMRAAPPRRCSPYEGYVRHALPCSSPGPPPSVLLPFQRRLDALAIRFDAVTLRDLREGVLDGYAVVVVPAVGGSADELSGIRLVTSVAGITPGLGS